MELPVVTTTTKPIENKPNIQVWPIEKLHEWDNNPRSITEKGFDRLKKQIYELDVYKPLLVSEDGTVLGGNMRLKAFREYGFKNITVSVVKADTEELKIKYALSDNDQVGRTEPEQIIDLLDRNPDINLDDYAIHLQEPETLTEFMSQFKQATEDEVPEIDEGPAISKQGELYQLGEHRLLCGDATNKADMEKLMAGKLANMVFTDPPYNINYTPSDRQGIMNDNMASEEFYQFLLESCRNIVSYSDGGIYICMSSKEMPNLKKAFENAGGHWQSFIIWVKNTFTLSNADYQNQYEAILYGWNNNSKNHYFVDYRNMGNIWHDLDSKAKYDGKKTTMNIGGIRIEIDGKATGRYTKGKFKIDIWRHDKPSKSLEHPTMKPIALCAEAIQNSSQAGDTVMDIFGGSGSTLIACEQINRKCRMMELDPKFCDVIRKRWAKYIGKEDQWELLTPAI
jgi:DNA modification methylase